MKKKPLYIIDAYALIYRSYFAFMSKPLRNRGGNNVSALFGFARALIVLLDTVKAPCLVAAFDSREPTFRHKKYPPYKATREKAPEDLHAQVPLVKELLAALGVPMLAASGFEADDIIATLADKCKAENRECYIVSSDKDLLQLVGDGVWLFRPTKNKAASNGQAMYEAIGPEEVKAEWGIYPSKILDLLSLSGDSSDNVPGVRGIGEKIAVKLMTQYGSLDDIYQNIAAITGASARKLAEDKENAYLSRELITLVRDVPLKFTDIEDFSTAKLHRETAAALLMREDIPSVAEDMSPGSRAKYAKQTPEEQRSAASRAPDARGGGTSSRARRADASDGAQDLSEGISSPPLEAADKPVLKTNHHIVSDMSEATELFARVRAKGSAALDFETTSLEAWRTIPVGISLAIEMGEAWYLPLAAHGTEKKSSFLPPAEVRDLLAPILADPAMTIIAHNAKFDYEVSRAWGLPRWKAAIWDTMVAAWLCDPGRTAYSLEAVASYHLNLHGLSYNDIVPKDEPFNVVDLELAGQYSCEDADFCLRLKLLFEDMLDTIGAKDLFWNLEMPLLPILAEMEGAGIKIDAALLRDYGVELGQQLDALEAETWKLVGHSFNLASPKQLQHVLFEERKLKPGKKTKTGYSTDVAVLEELARIDKAPELILRHRSLAKLKSTYVDTLAEMADESGRLHTSFVQTGTATGRLSSRDPNLQNIPIRAEEGRRIRESFIAAEGNVLISADYSQIELVVLAHLSQDAALIGAFTEGKDVHARTAALIFGVDEDHVDAAQRRIAKTINFGVMYGMSAFRLSNELNISRREAAMFIEAYFKTYSGVREFIDRLIAEAEKSGYASTLFGRRRAIPTINSSNRTEKAQAERMAVNTPIQGSAADIVKRAMINLDATLRGGSLGAGHSPASPDSAPSATAPASDGRSATDAAVVASTRLLLQVHDELILECPKEYAQRSAVLVRTIMENAVTLSIPLRVGVEIGQRWGDFH